MTSRFLKQSLVAASIITIAANIVSRLFGYVREAATANYFGTSEIFDTFILAFTIPELVAAIIFTALPAGLLPSLRKIRQHSVTDDSDVFWTGLASLSILFGMISILIYAFRGNILFWLAPQLTADQFLSGKRILAILSVFVFFRGVEAYFRSWLFEKKHFIGPATSNILLNIVILSALFTLYGRLNIEALAYGWLAGTIALCIYNGSLAILVVKPSIKININNRWVIVLLQSTLAIAAIQSIPLIYPLVDRYIAAKYLGPGHIAALRYAMILIQVPTGIFVIAFNVVSFPWITDYSVPHQLDNLRKLYRDSFRLIIYVMGFVAAGVVVFSREIVYVAFQRGAFNFDSLSLTSGPLLIYGLGVVLYSLYIFQMRIYYARQILMRLGTLLFVLLLIKIIMSMVLVGPMKQNGLALATVITWVFGFAIMTVDVSRLLKVPLKNLLYPSVFKMLFMVALVTIYWILMAKIWVTGIDEGSGTLFLKLTVLAVSGAGLYSALGLLLKVPEQKKVFASLTSRFRRIKKES